MGLLWEPKCVAVPFTTFTVWPFLMILAFSAHSDWVAYRQLPAVHSAKPKYMSLLDLILNFLALLLNLVVLTFSKYESGFKIKLLYNLHICASPSLQNVPWKTDVKKATQSCKYFLINTKALTFVVNAQHEHFPPFDWHTYWLLLSQWRLCWSQGH